MVVVWFRWCAQMCFCVYIYIYLLTFVLVLGIWCYYLKYIYFTTVVLGIWNTPPVISEYGVECVQVQICSGNSFGFQIKKLTCCLQSVLIINDRVTTIPHLDLLAYPFFFVSLLCSTPVRWIQKIVGKGLLVGWQIFLEMVPTPKIGGKRFRIF